VRKLFRKRLFSDKISNDNNPSVMQMIFNFQVDRIFKKSEKVVLFSDIFVSSAVVV